MGHSDSPRAHPVALRFLRVAVTTPCVCVRLSVQARRRLAAWGFRDWQPQRPVVKEMEARGRPKFLENPRVPMPCSSTPAGSNHQAPAVVERGPRAGKDEDSQQEVISGLYRTASALTVYASPDGSPRRTQDSFLAAGQALPGGIRTRRVPAKSFRNVPTLLPPFPSFLAQCPSPLCAFRSSSSPLYSFFCVLYC
jgi:hypothetical protein